MHRHAVGILKEIIEKERHFIWNYETMVLLGDTCVSRMPNSVGGSVCVYRYDTDLYTALLLCVGRL